VGEGRAAVARIGRTGLHGAEPLDGGPGRQERLRGTGGKPIVGAVHGSGGSAAGGAASSTRGRHRFRSR